MIGEKFWNWEVLNLIKIDKPGKHYECLCSCGNIRIKAGTELRAGRGKKCQECQYKEMYDPEKEIGKIYGKWRVIRFVDIYRKLQRYENECECGHRGIHYISDLRCGKTTQCINCHNRKNALKNKRHGMHESAIYKVWGSMLQRCKNPKSPAYKWYGARGIKVCIEWELFDAFYSDMGDRPNGMTLDRIDNNGNYEKKNCRWVSHKENCNNRKR